MKRSILAIVLILLICGGFYGYTVFNKPHENIEKAKVFQHFESVGLIAIFANNQTKADQLLENNVISFEGKISAVKKSDDQYLFTFDSGEDYLILAYFQEKLASLVHLKEGDIVKVKGKYAGVIINDDDFLIPADIKIENCYVD